MSDKIETPQTETTTQSKLKDDFDIILGIQKSQAANAFQETSVKLAHDLVEAQPMEPLSESNVGTKSLRVVGSILIAALGAGGAAGAADLMLPRTEIKSVTTNVQLGEGIEQSVYRDFNELESLGVDHTDAYNQEDVMHQAIKFHTDKNNVVQPGEPVEVIATKSAIFGSVNYEAVDDRQQTESK